MPSACFDAIHNVSTPLKHAKGERTEKVEKRDFSAVGNGILWLTPCKLACERSLETGPNIVASVGDGRSWWHHSFDHNRPSTRLIPFLVLLQAALIRSCGASFACMELTTTRRRRRLYLFGETDFSASISGALRRPSRHRSPHGRRECVGVW